MVIADGGFQGNATLFRKYIGPRPDLVVQRGAGTGQGDGLTMAINAGAATTALDAFYGGILNRDALTDARLWPYPELDSIATAGMIVDSTGHRFVDEGLGGVAIANLLARRENPADGLLVFDSRAWEHAGRSARVPVNPCMVTAGGTLHEADTLESLAARIEVPARQLVLTVEAFNRAIAQGALASLQPARSSGKQAAQPIQAPPFLPSRFAPASPTPWAALQPMPTRRCSGHRANPFTACLQPAARQADSKAADALPTSAGWPRPASSACARPRPRWARTSPPEPIVFNPPRETDPMTTSQALTLGYLSIPDITPSALISAGARAGFSAVGLRISGRRPSDDYSEK
ncbi:hypothetical protein LP414_05925 [Polaromonas sp. P1(28)-13]|nr:hypothetical protein LP414_05925 [Polaromonas sp. P1(28)-13]